jgi:hypothetical protein
MAKGMRWQETEKKKGNKNREGFLGCLKLKI